MASPIDLTALMNDPETLKLIQEQAMSTTPMQPQVQGIGMPELPKDEKQIQKLIRQKFLESQFQQQQAVEESKRLLAEEMQKNQELGVLGRLDLRPFAAAARQYGATTAVVPTEAPADNKELMAKLRSEIQKSQQGLSQDQIDFLKTMKEDKRTQQFLAAEEKANKNFGLRVRTSVNSSEEGKKIRAIGDLNTKIATLIDKVNKTGASLSGKDKADLDSAFQDVKVGWKDSAGLGAIQKADENLIEQAIGDSPTTLKGLTGYALIGGKQGLITKLQGLRERAVTQGYQHLDSARSVFPYDEAQPIFKDFENKLLMKPAKAEASETKGAAEKEVKKVGLTEAQRKKREELLKKYPEAGNGK
jgi:hypothetical protein